MIAKFRFIKVNFGKLLGKFLENTGDNFEPKAKMSKSSILKNQTGSRGRLSDYNKSITTFELFHYKIVIYMISFVLRILTKILVQKMKTKRMINKKLFYFVYIHNRLHFIIFNLYLSGCIFLNTRSILHMKYFPETYYMIFDKYMNILCFFFYWWDILELLHTSLISGETADKNVIKEKQNEEDKIPEEVKRVKELLSKNEKTKESDQNTSALNILNETQNLGSTKTLKRLSRKLPS